MTGAESRRPKVSAIIVNWNTSDLLWACLASLRRHAEEAEPMEIIVVDNGSSDGSAEMVRERWPDVTLIVNSVNVGYTRANNQAIRVSRGEYLLLINADAMLTPGCLAHLVAQLELDAKAGAVGPRLVYGDGTWQRWTAGRDPGVRTTMNHYLFLERLPWKRFAGVYLQRDVRQPCQVDWISSACMVVRRSALDRVGLLDESLFVYMDDVDLCHRLRNAGWRVWYRPDAQATHLMGQSTRRSTGRVSPEALRSFNRYIEARHGRGAAVVIRGVEAIGFAMRLAAYVASAMIRRGDRRHFDKISDHWTHLKVSLEPRRSAPTGPKGEA